MTFFRGFTIQDWEIFLGNMLMFVTCIFYIAWWALSFWPKGGGKNAGANFFIMAAMFAGVAAIALLSLGINSLSSSSEGPQVLYILTGAAAVYIILLIVTKNFFQRPVTSELLLIIVWAAVELSAVYVMYSNGRLGMGYAITLTILVALAVCIGIVCYILYYRLDEISQFWDGLIPLIVDGGVVAIFLAVQAFS